MAQFLNDLYRKIDNVAESQHYVKLEDILHVAMKVERQLKRERIARYPLGLIFLGNRSVITIEVMSCFK